MQFLKNINDADSQTDSKFELVGVFSLNFCFDSTAKKK